MPEITQVMLEPTKAIQYWIGQVEQYDSGTILSRSYLSSERAFFIKAVTSSRTTWYGKDSMAIGSWVLLIGRYVDNERLQLVSGAAASVVRLDIACVEHLRTMSDVTNANRELSTRYSEPAVQMAPAPTQAVAPFPTVQAVAPAPIVQAMAPAPTGQAREEIWAAARTAPGDKTNIRAMQDITSLVVMQLAPGEPLLVQSSDGDWWGAKSRDGVRFLGYVRKDRVLIDSGLPK